MSSRSVPVNADRNRYASPTLQRSPIMRTRTRTVAPSRRIAFRATCAAIAVLASVIASSCTSPTAPEQPTSSGALSAPSKPTTPTTPTKPTADVTCDWVNPWVYVCK
jgi:hypothetical protein